MANNMGRSKKKIAGVILMIIGISGFILSVYSFFMVSYGSEFGQYLSQLIGLFALGLAFLLAVTGGILFSAGDNEERRRRK
jgi:hypothetical protein